MICFLEKFEVSRLHILDLFVSKHSFVSHNYRKIMRHNKNLMAASVSPVRNQKRCAAPQKLYSPYAADKQHLRSHAAAKVKLKWAAVNQNTLLLRYLFLRSLNFVYFMRLYFCDLVTFLGLRVLESTEKCSCIFFFVWHQNLV